MQFPIIIQISIHVHKLTIKPYRNHHNIIITLGSKCSVMYSPASPKGMSQPDCILSHWLVILTM